MTELYAIYRGDCFEDAGTVDELCKRHGWDYQTFRQLRSNKWHRRHKNDALCVYLIDEKEEI